MLASPRVAKTLVCYNRNNFGDQLSEVVVKAILGSDIKICNVADKNVERSTGSLVGLGSVLHFANYGDTIWGTGAIPERFRKRDLFFLSQYRRRVAPSWNVRAVRGPLTRDFMLKSLGIDCPEVYGDPAILLPDILVDKKRNPKRHYGVIPHYRDLPVIQDDNVMSPLGDWEQVLDFILECELVVSSSLHGIIVAEAFGVPAQWLYNESLPSAKSEGTFKYRDYYLSTMRDRPTFASSVESAVSLGKPEVPQFQAKLALKQSLMAAF